MIKFYVEIMNYEIEIDYVKLFVKNCFDVFVKLFIVEIQIEFFERPEDFDIYTMKCQKTSVKHFKTTLCCLQLNSEFL